MYSVTTGNAAWDTAIKTAVWAKGGAIQIAKLDDTLRFVLVVDMADDSLMVIIEQMDGTDALNCEKWVGRDYTREMACIAEHFFKQWAMKFEPGDPATRRRVQEAKEGAISERL